MLNDKKILIGITASIAAYKSILLVRLLVKAGAEVRVVMTPAAKDFVSPLVLSTLSKNRVTIELTEGDEWANHVMLGRWADVFVMAPLSCNTLAKMAHGQCDNLLLAVYLSATCPVVAVPAMDEDMWHHPATQRNIELIKGYGNHLVPVNRGELASGLYGDGRMAEPEAVITYLNTFFFRSDKLKGRKALVTAGPTYEAIDPVRFVGNHSSGKMGFAIAEALYEQGADVVLVTGPTRQRAAYEGIRVIDVVSAADMLAAAEREFDDSEITVMSAAVADYSPVTQAPEKIKKESGELVLTLKKTTDILKTLGQRKKDGQLLIGFALETHNEKEFAQKKLQSKNLDAIVLNSLRDKGAGFATDTNQVTVLSRSGEERVIGLRSKKEIAHEIVSFIIQQYA
ncbi:bifunctional phosphopantothenoylcysteine decarboxylase/phosphopantothenate--cysteine ligase CoaBC [Sediminibacterium soli]|uniref:bifunctional phosphopantothenoylcysteine decarboxylase/phosphopantothenate--cysteine ligase CoaBC n=1 Tax=Sediminibacterium soli TaxID=2698829 RepID=UPI0013795424|nr:bifunctional phosphopantothenoylcysteine decarboxylase/phosphopantothenate--cysteine ligase CoaBC [Sediminibacterium soli]NCI45721.1 bifunctional phosphopantothenoylcysteine decarboxylase/phosphopantothenate--cysteine ligase CoaBC [Sediminibacterium soli]